MMSFLEVCENTREKLNRKLSIVEIEFLEWMHTRYEAEQENLYKKDISNLKDQVHD